MELAKTRLKGRNGSRELKDLFIYTSLKCNMKCSHCFVESTPGNNTLDAITLGDALPIFYEAKNFGVKHIYFTGGEPFVNKEIIELLDNALGIAPVTVYTNATAPLERRLDDLVEITKRAENPLLLRVSFDHYDQDIHDIFYKRGRGSFNVAVATAEKASKRGIPIAVTAQEDIHNYGSEEYVAAQLRSHLESRGVKPEDVKVLPHIPKEEQLGRLKLSPISKSETLPEGLMCGNSRTVIKYDGKVHVFPCTILIPGTKEDLVNNYSKYDMGSTLKETLLKEQTLDHPRCRAYCVSGGATCANK